MKPVNLLPKQYRSARSSGGRAGSSYVLLGALGAVLVGVLLYTFTANQVTSREDDAAEAQAEADAAEARAAALAPFGDFQQVEQARLAAVSTLAEGRLDWERLARELAHVLPRGVRLDGLEGSTQGDDDGATASSEPAAPAAPESSTTTSSSTSTTSPSTSEAVTPTVTLTGCARNQPTVAKMLVRLRRLNGAEDVTLSDSTSSSETGGGGGEVADCPAYSFDATILLAAPAVEPQNAKAAAVPARLGGGE